MAITTLDGALAGMQYPRMFAKAVSGTLVAGRPFSSWGLAGIPGAGTYSAALNGIGYDRTSTGALGFDNPSSGNSYLARLAASVTQAGVLVLCDRIHQCGGFTITSTGAQAITTGTLNARSADATSNGEGVLAGVEISATTGSGTPTITLNYTNQAGTTGRSATNIIPTVATSIANTFYPIGLQAGDTGIRAVTNASGGALTLSATWTSGTMNLVFYRPIAALALPGALIPGEIDAITSGFPRIMDSSCLFFLFYPNTTSTSNIQGQVAWTQG
jgi:hypothetical protein